MEQKQPFDSRTVVAIALCLVFWFGWQKYLEKKYPEAMNPANRAKVVAADANKVEAGKTTDTSATKATSNDEIAIPKFSSEVKTENWTYQSKAWQVDVSNLGGRVTSIKLLNYKDYDGQIVDLLKNDPTGLFTTQIEGVPQSEVIPYKINAINDYKVELVAQAQGVTIKKTLEFGESNYTVKGRIQLIGTLKNLKQVSVGLSDLHAAKKETPGFVANLLAGGAIDTHEFLFKHGTKKSREHIDKSKAQTFDFEQTYLASVGQRYFTKVFLNKGGVIPNARGKSEQGQAVLLMNYPILDDSQNQEYSFEVYAGPRNVENLKSFDAAASDVVDFGMFSWIAIPLLQIMRWFYTMTHNYGVAIILLTILVRSLTFPLTYLSYKSMKAMQKIQPEIARLKTLYKDDNQKQQMEMLKLMRDNKVNPMSGCLPMLAQLPVFLALYQVFLNSIELYHAPFAFWIHDLSLKDPYFVLPILMGITMFVQQKITPTTMDPAQAKVMLFMPVMFSFLMMGLPSGLTLYIFVSTLFGIFQQLFIMKDKSQAAQVVVRKA